MIKTLLTLSLSLFWLASAEANQCSVFSELWPERTDYQSAKDSYQNLGTEKGFEILLKRLQDGPLRIEEVIGYLDANIKGEVKLYDKVKLYAAEAPTYSHPILRYLTAPVKVKSEAIRIQRSNVQTEVEVRDFVTHLLKAVYKVELQLTKARLLQSFPKSKEQIEKAFEADSFFYSNMNVFAKFLELAPRDAMTENPWFGAFSRFLFNYSDPILNHRLNLKDFTEFQQGTLDVSLRRRLLAPIIARQARRQIFWGALLSSVMMIPTNFAESNQAYAIVEKHSNYLLVNKTEIEQRYQDRYDQVYRRLIIERESLDTEAMQQARQSGNADKVQDINIQILELREQSL